MLVRRKAGDHLLIGMNVVPEVSQPVAKFLHIKLQHADFAGNVN